MRNIDLRSAYAGIYENRRAARAAGGFKDDTPKQTDPSKPGFTGISGSIKEIMKQNKEIEAKNKMKKEEVEQLDEALPLVAAAAGKLAAAGAAKAATAGAAKVGLAKAAGSKLGKMAINKGASAVGNKVQDSMSNEEEDKKKNEEFELLDEEGKKDACYNKVKSRYSVWPSAYASGALVKCRQKGAKNWGNSSKKEEVEAVFATLLGEGIVETEDAAINLITHMSDEWYDKLVEGILSEGYPGHEDGDSFAKKGKETEKEYYAKKKKEKEQKPPF